jgi:NADPH:quinone reductase-like Zn-dependent oxidoreductase
VLQSEGRYVIVGGNSEGRWLGALTTPLKALVVAPFVSQTPVFFMAELNRESLATLQELVAAGQVTPVIDRRYPLSQATDAIDYLEQGRARGKVIVTLHGSGDGVP